MLRGLLMLIAGTAFEQVPRCVSRLIQIGDWMGRAGFRNALGKTVLAQKIPAGSRQFNLNLAGLPTGMYFLEVVSAQGQFSQRLMISGN